MKRHIILSVFLFLFVAGAAAKGEAVGMKEQVKEWMKNRPVKFLENKGQMTDDQNNPMPFVLFKASTPGTDMYITEKGITYLFFKAAAEVDDERSRLKEMKEDEEGLKYARVDMNIKGASIKKENSIAEQPSVTDFNFFAPHCPDGIYGVKEYEKITIKDIYPGIDWVLYNSNTTGFKYDFIVHAGADPKQIRLVYEWARLDKKGSGNLEIYTPVGSVIDHKPVSFLQGSDQPVETAFKIDNKNEVSFFINDYDNSQTLVIDPQLTWTTYYGGNDDEGALDVAVDKNGNVYITGYLLRNTSFPTFNPGGGVYYQGVKANASRNVAIVKFNSAGVRLWATYYSGNVSEGGYAITTDNAGNLYVTGQTKSTVFPLQNLAGAYNQSVYGGGAGDMFILKFNSSSVRLWASYFGGSLEEDADLPKKGITIDNIGNIYVTGTTASWKDFPLKNPGGGAYFQGAMWGTDVYVLKFSAGSHSLLWSTYFGGSGLEAGNGIAVDAFNNIYITGYTTSTNFPVKNLPGAYNQPVYGGGNQDIFLAKFDGANSSAIWSTYYGGSKDDWGANVVVNTTGDIFVAGKTQTGGAGNNFPLYNPGGGAYFEGASAGTQMGIIMKFNAGSLACGWSTYYGGSSGFYAADIAADKCGNIYITGLAGTSMPVLDPGGCSNYFDGTFSGTNADIGIIEFNSNCVRLWATYFGGNTRDWSNAIAVSNTMDVYAVGEYNSTTGIPLTNPGAGAYFQTANGGGTGPDDWAIVKFSPVFHTISQSQVDPSSCSCNGTATVSIGCGLPPYNYKWSNGQNINTASTTNTATGLCPGVYKVTITDGACTQLPDTVTFNIAGAGASVSLSSVQGDLICNSSCNGSASVSASGGIAPYTYSWSNGQTSVTGTGFCAGVYSVAVKDANNCTSVISVNITQPPQMGSWYSTQWSCLSNTATVTVGVANAVSPYTYLWSNGQASQTATGLISGNYTVTVTDKNGCIVSQAITITQPPALVITASGTNISCSNQFGSASVTVLSGTSPFSYNWSNGAASPTISLVGAGNYTVTVTDGNGCVATQTVSVSSTSPASATFTQSPGGTVCAGTTVFFTNTGTVGTYQWLLIGQNVSGTTLDFSYTFLTAGTYTMQHTVTTGGCSNSVNNTVTVINCSGINVNATGSSVCAGSCATVTSSGTGGAGPYTYTWSNGPTTQNISPCPASTTTYTVTIKDSGGNTSTSTAVVTVNPAIALTTIITNINCNGGTGSVSASGGGGTSPYLYSWSNGETAQTVTGLTAGIYTVTITDSKSCTVATTAAIISPPAIIGQFAKGTAGCSGCGCKQWILVTAAGGTSPYSYTWPDGYNNRYKNQLCPGVYSVNIKDKNGCSVNVNLNVP